MSNLALVKIDPKEYGLEKQSASKIEEAFLPKVVERDSLIPSYEAIINKEVNEATCKEAGNLRKRLVKIRTGIASIHKSQKAFFLASGRFVDAWKNKETEPISQMEEKLSEIEKHFENLEKQRLEQLQADREAILSDYIDDAHERKLYELDQDTFDALVAAKKKQYEDRLEAEAKAEQERIEREEAERKERERIAEENRRLQEELRLQREKEEAERKERERIEAERLSKEEEAKRILEAELERIRLENEAEIRKEREERERIEAELRAKEEAERKRVADLKAAEEARIEAEAAMSDKDKVNALTADLIAIKRKYQFKSMKNQTMYANVQVQIDRILQGML